MTEKKHYAILRIEKIRSFEHLRRVGLHNTRAIPARTVSGTNPPIERLPLNGPFDVRAKALLTKLDAKFEKNKILAAEILMTASPEWWEKASKLDKKEWIEKNEGFLHDKFGQGLISISFHTDESTPHIQAVALPLYHKIKRKRGRKPKTAEGLAIRQREEAAAKKIWRLSYDKILGGPSRGWVELQTLYHSYVAHLGLSRGEDTYGQKKKHNPLKEQQTELNRRERIIAAREEALAGEQAFLLSEEEKFSDRLNNFHHEERNVEARLQQLIKREERIATGEVELNAREANLTRREQIAEIREKMCDNNDKLFADRLSSVQQQQRENDRQTQNTQSQLREIAERENNLRASVAELEAQKGKLEIFEQQLIWVSQIPSAKRSKATSGMEAPTPEDGSDSKQFSHKALKAEWSERLKAIAIFLMKELARKARLKATINRLRKTMSEMRRKEVALNKREARIISGERRVAPLVNEAEDKLAAAANIKEIAEQSARQSIQKGQSAQKLAEDAQIEWRNAKADLDAVNASIQGSERKVEDLRKKRENLVTELSWLEAQNAQMEVQTKELRAEAAVLESRKTQFEAQNRVLIDERQKLDGDRAQHDMKRRSVEKQRGAADLAEQLLNDAVSGRVTLRLRRDMVLMTSLSNDKMLQPRAYQTFELPTWFPYIVDRLEKLDNAVKQINTDANDLQVSRKKLEAIHPELAPKIEEQRKQDPVSVRKIFDQLSSDGQGRGG